MVNYLRLMRPSQWIKNVVVLAGPVFSCRMLDAHVAVAFVAFCLVSSASYAINDVVDRSADQAHPTKRHRPIACGAVSPLGGIVLAVVLASAAIAMSHEVVSAELARSVCAYFCLIFAYSLVLKQRPILDVVVIAVGFVLRAVAGAQAVGVYVSPWLMVCTFTLCMFLGFGKRRCEIAIFTDPKEANAHRSTLNRYTPELLNHLTSVSAGLALITFLLYTMDVNPSIPQPPFNKQYLLYTLPLVVYALFRYAMMIETGQFTGPMQIIRNDRAILLTAIAWAVIVCAVVVRTSDTSSKVVPADRPQSWEAKIAPNTFGSSEGAQ